MIESASSESSVAAAPRKVDARGSLEARRRLVAQSMNVGNPPNNAKKLGEGVDLTRECQIELPVDAIKAYEANPRRSANARFDEIKASIREGGVQVPITVTRRPGEDLFVVEAGGNTRLAAVQALWRETGDIRFSRLAVIFRPWQSESHVLIAHLIENEQREGLTCWDKASAFMAVRTKLEQEDGCSITLRQLGERLAQSGLPISSSMLGLFRFAVEDLEALGEARSALSARDLKVLQPKLNLLRRHAESVSAAAAMGLETQVLEPTLRQHAIRHAESRLLDAASVYAECEETFARLIGKSVAQLRGELQKLEPGDCPTDDLGSNNRLDEGTAAAPSVVDNEAIFVNTERAGEKRSTLPFATPDSSEHLAPVTPVKSDLTNEVHAESLARMPSSAAQARCAMQAFAGLIGIDDCLRFSREERGHIGFRLLPLPNDAGIDEPLRKWGWTVLSALAKHFSGSARTESREVGEIATDAERISLTVIDWLTDPDSDAAYCFCNMISGVRFLRASFSSANRKA